VDALPPLALHPVISLEADFLDLYKGGETPIGAVAEMGRGW